MSPQQIRSEIVIMSSLNHPNIVNFREIFVSSTSYYVVMECVTGGELFERIIELKRYSEHDASNIVRQILLGLEHLHDKLIVHCDIKPENILLSDKTPEATIKIADFGLAMHVGPNDLAHKQMVGTIAYMAPEVLELEYNRNGIGFGRAADCWSVGVIMYLLLSGGHPFQNPDQNLMRQNVLYAKWAFVGNIWHSISSHARNLIWCFLQKNPRERITVKQALQHPWIKSASTTEIPPEVQTALRSFLAKRKFVGGVKAVLAMNRLKKVSGSTTSNTGLTVSSEQSSPPVNHYRIPISNTDVVTIHSYSEIPLYSAKTSSHWYSGLLNRIESSDETNLKAWFDSVDIDHNGFIDDEELSKAVLWDGMELGIELARKLIHIFDSEGSGTIDFKEYASFHQFLHDMHAAFFKGDKTGTGNLDHEAILSALIEAGFNVSRTTINKLIQEFSRGGTIDFKTFFLMCAHLVQVRNIFHLTDVYKSGYMIVNFEQLALISSVLNEFKL
eukprot:TRINITY_DN2049_c0_g1_i4.p1 TRINITY_DN2049_c0_g1~~TRINITY_DN2049_c0_g1_i4.p1  ORF type:complete len:576 (-),score=59.83 TRINITY_DN2049_c0_g1_i4:33-1535(-)